MMATAGRDRQPRHREEEADDQGHRDRAHNARAVGGVWPDEEDNFTPWLAEHLEYLDVVGMGRLTCKGVEVGVAGKSLDILAELRDGRVVAIENQYGKADEDHLKRGLHYALGTKAVALILIAQQFSA
jgi:hypothetical protein